MLLALAERAQVGDRPVVVHEGVVAAGCLALVARHLSAGIDAVPLTADIAAAAVGKNVGHRPVAVNHGRIEELPGKLQPVTTPLLLTPNATLLSFGGFEPRFVQLAPSNRNAWP